MIGLDDVMALKRDMDYQDRLHELTDEACSVAARHKVMEMVRSYGPNGAFVIADMIDHTCQFTWDQSIGLVAGTPCGLEDWHAFARELRGPWETYG